MWNGMFYKSSFEDHFDLVGIDYDSVLGIYLVTVVFHKNPGKQYVFEIPQEDFVPTKPGIAQQILEQLRVDSE